MKKLFKSMFMLTIAALAFTSCEDVPAPYDDPNNNVDPDEPGIVVEPTGDGTLANPFNVAAAVKYITDGGSEETEVYVKGTVVSVQSGSYDPSYGSLKYYISDDGKSNNQFLVFNGYKGPNRTKFSGEDDLKPGDEVVICGKLVNYNGTKEFTTGNYTVSINGETPGNTPDVPDTPADGTYISETFSSSWGVFTPKTVKGTSWVLDSYGYAKATGYDNASKVTTPSEAYIVSNAVDMSASKEAAVTFDYVLRYVTTSAGEPIDGIANKVLVTDNYTGDPATTTWKDITGTLTEVRDWSAWTKFSAAVPAEILGKSKVVFALYYACSASSGTWEVKNFAVKEGKDEGGEGGGEVSENSITINAVDLGLENATEVGTQTLTDGTVLKFDGGGNSNLPKYYNTGKNIRMYPKNSVTITAKKKIASVIFNVDEYNGTTYNASGDISANPGSVNTDGKVVTISAVNNASTVITNTSGVTGAASQVRIVSLTINYAE